MRKWGWFALTLFVIGCDQITKYWASIKLLPYHPDPLFPMVNFTLAFNTGAAFSFLSDSGQWHHWFFACFSGFMSIALIVWMIRTPLIHRIQLCALSLILGGAIGNLIDRIRLGFVIDFIDVYFKNHHWPVFNVADSAICVGIFLLVIEQWVNKKSQS